MFQTGDFIMFPGQRGIFNLEMLLEGGSEHTVDQTAFPGTGDPGHTGECSQRDPGGDVLQVIMRDPFQSQEFSVSFDPLFRNFDLLFPGQILSGERIWALFDGRGRAGSHQFSAVNSCGRSEIQDIISRPDRICIVFHNHHGVSDIPKVFQCSKKPVIIPLMQSDTRFIQNVKHSYQPAAQLGRQPDPLSFSAG